MSSSETIEAMSQLMAITGADEHIALSLVKACENNIEMAVSMFYHSNLQNGPLSARNAEALSHPSLLPSLMLEDDNLRVPIVPKRGVLIEDFQGSAGISDYGSRPYHFYADRDFAREQRWQEQYMQNDIESDTSSQCSRPRAGDVFRAPVDQLYRGLYSNVKPEGQRRNRLMRVNIPDGNVFATQVTSRPHTIHGEPGFGYEVVTRQNLLAMDLVNIFQGVPGKYITFNPNEKFAFHVERIAEFASNDIFLAKRLSVIGQHFKIIRNCATIASGNTSKGLVFQSLGSALEDQVREFYKLMTSIQANFHNSSNVVTMHKLTVWIYETATKFEALSSMTAKCKSKRGGALVAVIYDYMNHGDPIVRDLVRSILSKVVKPIRQMMNHWIFYGELKDDFREFFIGINSDTNTAAANDFWRDKYIINKQMLPGFISKDQAFKILNTGKAISMLREVENKVNLFLPVYDQLKMSFENSKLETLFVKRGAGTQSSDFSHLLAYLYKEICQVALNLLNEKYTLHGHFYAHKRYLLFGQGDFISYLCEVISPMMGSVVPSKMKIYSLTPCLELAISKTSANCENPEILSRLDINIGNSRNRFCLKYKSDGPLSTIFTEQTHTVYAKTFDLLWTIKRFNLNTQKYFIQLRMMAKHLKRLPATFNSINNTFSVILHQISHFLYTIESYFSSTIENRWLSVKHELDNPLSLDRLIKAHRKFLQAIERQLFFTDSPELNTEFNNLCDQIWEFYHMLDQYITPIYKMATESDGAKWEDELNTYYKEYDSEYFVWLVNFGKTFNITVVNFLENLVETEEDTFQELCLCIDFNHFYKRTILAD